MMVVPSLMKSIVVDYPDGKFKCKKGTHNRAMKALKEKLKNIESRVEKN